MHARNGDAAAGGAKPSPASGREKNTSFTTASYAQVTSPWAKGAQLAKIMSRKHHSISVEKK